MNRNRSNLEGQLEAATRDFVGKILGILRNASLADVASVGLPDAPQPIFRTANRPTPSSVAPAPSSSAKRGRRPRVDPKELEDKVFAAISAHGGPMAARDLATQLGVHLDALARPLKQLRDDDRIVKHGEKRASKYSVR